MKDSIKMMTSEAGGRSEFESALKKKKKKKVDLNVFDKTLDLWICDEANVE